MAARCELSQQIDLANRRAFAELAAWQMAVAALDQGADEVGVVLVVVFDRP